MGKLYTFDDKLLVGGPEIRIGDKCYPVDDRTKKVKKLLKDLNAVEKDDEGIIDTDEMIIKAAFDKNAKEILNMDLPYAAQQKLAQMALAAMTGEEYEDNDKDRFQKEEKSEE